MQRSQILYQDLHVSRFTCSVFSFSLEEYAYLMVTINITLNYTIKYLQVLQNMHKTCRHDQIKKFKFQI